jgi:predicted MFS family arabinose efflux permease
MFVERGITTGQVAVLLFAWSFVAFTLEVPTGALADRFSRRRVLAVAGPLRGLGYLLWWQFPSFAGYLAGFILWGVESALASGSFEALVYDELHSLGVADRYVRIMGRATSLALTAQIGVGVAAAVVVRQGFDVVLLASAAISAGAGLVAWRFPEARRADGYEREPYWSLLRMGVGEVVRNPALRRLVFLSGVVLGFGAVDEFLGLVLRDAGASNSSIALWHSAFFVAGVAGSLVAHRSARLPERSLAIIATAWAATLLLAAMLPYQLVGLMLAAFTALFYFQRVALDARVQAIVSSSARATVTSVEGLAAELGALTAFTLFGAFAGASSVRVATGVLGAVIVLAATAFGVAVMRTRPTTPMRNFGDSCP